VKDWSGGHQAREAHNACAEGQGKPSQWITETEKTFRGDNYRGRIRAQWTEQVMSILERTKKGTEKRDNIERAKT